MTFTQKQQVDHRVAFIQECRQKAWGARCHADWVGKELDEVLAVYQKLQAEDQTLDADIKELSQAVDSHTVDNREKRKEKQERRNKIAQEMAFIGQNAQQGQKTLAQLHQSAESALSLAAHAETWEWEEVEAKMPNPEDDGPNAEGNKIVVVETPGDLCGNTKKLSDGSTCPGCRACQ